MGVNKVIVGTEVANEPQEVDSPETATVAQRSAEAVGKTSLRSRLLPHILVLLTFTLLTIIATWPMFPNLGGYLMDKGDPLFTTWGMAWQAHAIATNPLTLFDANVNYPFKGTLTFDELSFTEAMLGAPFYWLTGNPVLSHNIIVFTAFILSGYGLWLLVRELTGSAWAGLLGGTAYAFSFYMMTHLPHTTLLSAQWLPFILLAAYKLFWTRQWRWAWAFAIFFALQALSGHYLAYYAAILLAIFVIYYSLAQRHRFTWQFIGKLAVGSIVSVLLILPIALPFSTLQAGYGFKRDLFQVERFSNTLPSFLAVFRGNPLYRKLLSPFFDPGPWAIERSAFPGFGILLLSLIGVAGSWRYSRARRAVSTVANAAGSAPSALGTHATFYLIVALFSAILSLGPTLQLNYPPTEYDPNAINGVLPLPYVLLFDWVPGFQSMRVAARIDVLTALSLAVLAGLGAFFMLRWLRERMSWRTARTALPVAAALIALVPLFETWSVPLNMTAIPTRGAVPPVYGWLAQQPHTVYAEYPMTYYKRGDANAELGNMYQYFSSYSWDDTINGSLTIRPFSYSAVVHETEDCFPCVRSVDTLWALDTRYVVAHLEYLSAPQRTDFLWRTSHVEGGVLDSFTPVKEFGDDRVYTIKKSPSPLEELKGLIPPGASLLLAEPQNDPIRVGKIGGGYVAALGYFLRDGRRQYGDPSLSFGQSILPFDPNNRPDYAILWAQQDSATAGYLPGYKMWSNGIVTLYARGPGVASRGTAP